MSIDMFTLCRCLYYCHFSIKSDAVDIFKNGLGEAILIGIQDIRFYRELLKKKKSKQTLFIILMPTRANLGSLLYGDVHVILNLHR